MNQHNRPRKQTPLRRSALGALLFAVLATPSLGDVTSSGLNTTVTPTGTDFTITGGTRAGGNLFQSFGNFSITSAQSATFANELGASNIIGRVTGGNASNIDGSILSQTGANLYLINPAGMMFGQHASINVNGSFYASTADYLKFSDGTVFSADPSAPVTLTMASPAAFGFLENSGGSSALVVGTRAGNPDAVNLTFCPDPDCGGHTVHLSGGNVTISNTDIKNEGGSIQVVAVREGEVSLADGSGIDPATQGGTVDLYNTTLAARSVNGPSGEVVVAGRDVTLTGSALTSSAYGSAPGGEINVTAENLTLKASPDWFSKIQNNAYVNATGAGGSTVIRADTLTLLDNSVITANTYSQQSANARGGNIDIHAGDVTVEGGSQISSNTRGVASGGNIGIDASRSVTLDGVGVTTVLTHQQTDGNHASGLFANAESGATGDGGNIAVNTPTLQIEGGAQVGVTTFGAGNGGLVKIVGGNAVFSGLGVLPNGTVSSSGLVAATEAGSTGHGGSLNVTVDTLRLENGAQINASTRGAGDGGNITMTARDIALSGMAIANGVPSPSGLFAAATEGSSGNGGAIDLNFHSLSLSEGAQVSSATRGAGEGGTIYLNCPSGVCISDLSWRNLLSTLPIATLASAVDTLSRNWGAGSTLTLSGSSAITASTTIDGSGRAGDLIGVVGTANIQDGAKLAVSSSTNASGGVMLLNVDSLNLYGGARIESANTGTGLAGSIGIHATDSLRIQDNSRVTLETASGNAGNLYFNVANLLYLRNSAITTSAAAGLGNGGDIWIDPIFVVLDKSQIIANALFGNGGNITIVTDFFLPSADSLVSASSQFGIQGTVNIISPYANLTKNLGTLPAKLLSTEDRLREECAAVQHGSTFVLSGLNRAQPSPDDILEMPFHSVTNDCGGG